MIVLVRLQSLILSVPDNRFTDSFHKTTEHTDPGMNVARKRRL